MIRVQIDLSRADAAERASFLALPGVARAIDSLAHPTSGDVIELRLDEGAQHDGADAPPTSCWGLA